MTPKQRLSGDALRAKHYQEAQEKTRQAEAAEVALDEMIRRSIELYGP